jgi:hypothetical protein
MAQTSWPFQAVDTTETQFSQWARHIASGGRSGVNGIPTGTDLKVTANSSGMQVFVATGQAMVRGHFYASTASETLTIGSANTNPRIDSIVLKLDPSVNSVVLQVVAGTAASSPVAPTLTQTDSAVYQFKLADVRVEANVTTIDGSKVTDYRQFLMDIWTTANRPTGFLGLTGYNTTTGKLESHNGTTWADVTSSISGDSISSGTIAAARIADLDAAKIVSGTFDSARIPTVPVAKGGTGLTSPTSGSYIKGAGSSGLSVQTGIPSTDVTGVISVAQGGTGASTESDARTALGVAPTVHNHTAAQITDPVNLTVGKIYAGGTTGGAATRIFVQSTTPTGMSTGDLWFW